jgi:hypothetical protein
MIRNTGYSKNLYQPFEKLNFTLLTFSGIQEFFVFSVQLGSFHDARIPKD